MHQKKRVAKLKRGVLSQKQKLVNYYAIENKIAVNKLRKIKESANKDKLCITSRCEHLASNKKAPQAMA